MTASPTSSNWPILEVRIIPVSPGVRVMHVYAHSPSLAAGGVDELAAKFHVSKPQYGLCKVANTETGAPQIALISWVSSAGVTRTRFL